MRRRSIALAAALAVALGGSAVAAAPHAVAAQHYKVVATDPKDDARIVVPLADRLILRLTACDSCGYSWKITRKPDAAVIAFDKRLTSISQCAEPCTGGNALERFRFLSKAAGGTVVKFGYFGPGKSKPSKTLRLRLAVTG